MTRSGTIDDGIDAELLERYDRPGPRYTSYPTVPTWHDGVGNETYRTALTDASRRPGEPFALYAHLPFCRSRCFYCGCNTTTSRDPERIARYVGRLGDEMDAVARLLGDRRTVAQLHLGGGTPTAIGLDALDSLVGRVRSTFALAPVAELSIEVDPRVVGPDDIGRLRAIGFDRVSFGVQDVDPDVQRAIGRRQPTAQVRAVLEAARDVGFRSVNVDLICGLPRQTPSGFAATLDTVVGMRPDRIALYSYAHLPTLRRNQARIATADLPDPATKHRLAADAASAFGAAGYVRIGMDHYALAHDELALAHAEGRLRRTFMGYTVQDADEWIGLGSSAIGYVGRTYVQNHAEVGAYEQAVEATSLAVRRGLELSDDDVVRRHVIGELMCNLALRFDDLRDRFGVDYADRFAEEDRVLEPLVADGLVVREPDALVVTPLGRTFVRNVAMVFDSRLRTATVRPTFSRTV
ncbi:MAG: oxygen-independent coproporphyrinogen III oxidase [Actinomycetota bacterium]|nr:oxygen-independent coproporphyrinogen III oxidase [Actinomycetota bacterium]